jgi:ribosomal protein S16
VFEVGWEEPKQALDTRKAREGDKKNFLYSVVVCAVEEARRGMGPSNTWVPLASDRNGSSLSGQRTKVYDACGAVGLYFVHAG